MTELGDKHLNSQIESIFCQSLGKKYLCKKITFRDNLWNEIFNIDVKTLDRRECLFDVLRGVSTKNFLKYHVRFNYNLKQKGYYLYIYELMPISYSDHVLYRDCYYHITEALKREFISVINNFNGGEVFYFSPTTIYVIINDLMLKAYIIKQIR